MRLDVVPLDPDAHDARQQLLDELAKSEYLNSKPNLFDQLVQAFQQWLDSLRGPSGGPFTATGFLVVGVIVVLLLLIALLVFGLPRMRRRSTIGAPLFGDDDTRGSEELRSSSARAAAAGDLDTAVLERFRAIARALTERTIVVVSPGTTAQGFATRAVRAFPDHEAALQDAARVFDSVRYLIRPATRAQYDQLLALDGALEHTRPHLIAELA